MLIWQIGLSEKLDSERIAAVFTKKYEPSIAIYSRWVYSDLVVGKHEIMRHSGTVHVSKRNVFVFFSGPFVTDFGSSSHPLYSPIACFEGRVSKNVNQRKLGGPRPTSTKASLIVS